MPASKPDAERPTPANLAFAWLIALIAVAGLALSPGSGYAPHALADWHDQQIFLSAAEQTIEQGLPDAANRMLVGPAYVGLTVTLAALFGLSAGDALILLSRITFVACMAILALVAIRDRARAEPRVQLVFVAVAVLSLLTSVWFRVLDIPWTHFVAAALLGGMVLVSLSRIPLAARAALVGVLAVFLVQTRLFEALVALIAACLIAPVAVWRNWADIRPRPAATLGRAALHLVLPALVGGVVALAAIGLMSHNWSLYQQYENEPGMVIRPELAPLKTVQLFWDTCFATLCDYAASPTVSPLADSFDSWRQPLLLQLPGLAAAVAGLLVWLAQRPSRVLKLPLGVLFAILTAGGTILAYVSGAPSGSPHLKFGFFRDFIAPLLLLTTAFIAALATQRGRAGAGLIAPMAVYFIVLLGLTALRAVGLPTLPGPRVSQLQITSSCVAGECTFGLLASDAAGNAVPYDDLAYVECLAAPLQRPVLRISQLRLDAGSCPRVGIVPVATGLLYTPDDANFRSPGLDLGKLSDSVTVPPKP